MNKPAVISPTLFAKKVLKFYDLHGRKDLPWQHQPPYRVWVSEVMLQQTQVKTVIPYYQKFIARFPDVFALASANIDEVLNLWQGLGYYSRARNLHRCAQKIVDEFQGEFPNSIEAMESLPGIGRSTAGAILSLSMGQPAPILDGNVKRVLARVFLVEGWYGQSKVARKLWTLTEKYTPKTRTGDFNQAMMDLGASYCSRTKPRCDLCPLSSHCLAHQLNKTTEYPHKKPKKVVPIKSAKLLLQLNDRHQVLLEKRPLQGIWGGLWSLPQLTDMREVSEDNPEYVTTPDDLVDEITHTFTHFKLKAQVITQSQTLTDEQLSGENIQWQAIDNLSELAFPTPIKQFLFRFFQIPVK